MAEPCWYISHTTTGTDDRKLSTRAAAEKAGVGATSVRKHRNKRCSCHRDTASAPTTNLRDDINALTGKMDLGPDGGEFIDVQTTEQVTDWTGIFKRFNLDPDVFEIVDDTVRMSTWQTSKRTENGDRDIQNLYSYKARFRRKQEAIDLPALYAEAREWYPLPKRLDHDKRTTVVVWSDPQIGKTGSRGGTKELLQRSKAIRSQLTQVLRERNPERIALLDAGDGIENFESGGSPDTTNDLSLPNQLDLYATELYKWLIACHVEAPVDVAVVPSNHSRWRRGKQDLGKPSDDFGIFTHRQVQKIAEAADMDVTWHHANEYDESLVLDVRGTNIGLVHGHQYGPGQAVSWWTKQAFGAQEVTDADVLVSGHYHHFAMDTAGRNKSTGKQRWWIQAPTLDAGSDWYRNKAGADSDPGVLIFDVTDDGFDLGSLTILTA